MDGTRRRINTYGRTSKRPVVHDLFALAPKPASHLVPSSNVTTRLSREVTPNSDVSAQVGATKQLKHNLLAELDAISQRLKSPARKARLAKSPATTSASMFDIELSDEETEVKAKRRKVTPDGSDIDDRASRGRSVGLARANRGELSKEAKIRAKSAAKGSHARVKPTARHTRTHSLKSRPRPITTPLSPIWRLTPEPITPPGIRSPASDTSAASMVTTRSATKRKRDAGEGALSDVSSPSQLELSSLRLTPTRPSARSRSGERDGLHGESLDPKKVRRRLIDRLDAAKPNADGDTDMTGVIGASGLRRPLRLAPSSRRSGETPSKPVLSRQSSDSQPEDEIKRNTVRPRKYGKQRSHLRDMLTGPDSLSQPSSQQSHNQYGSQLSAMTDSQPSQFEFEIPSEDEPDAGVQLKSIHELRQAGTINRFDRDLDNIFEDIACSTKAVRIAALMQLVRRLKEQAFGQHLLDRGKVSFLLNNIRPDYDVLSASLAVLAFWTLAHSRSATGQILLQLYSAMFRLPARLLSENRPLSAIAKDPGENLSKALISDLAEFEAHVLDRSSGTAGNTAHIIISRITVRSVEALQVRLVAGGEALPLIPASWVQSATTAISQHLKAMDASNGIDAGRVEGIRLILAWLELAEASSTGIGNKMSPLQLGELGGLLGDLLNWAFRATNGDIERPCLKLVIALSNEGKPTSAALASTKVTDSVFNLLNGKYPRLLHKASAVSNDGVKTADDTDTVVLALGCLLAFADSDDVTRMEVLDMMGTTSTRSPRVTMLVDFFKMFVNEADEAIDESKAHILIPFGYLSLLLCTISLNITIRQQITARLDRDFGELLERATTFLNYMRSVSMDDVSPNEFVDRFSMNLEAVRATSGN